MKKYEKNSKKTSVAAQKMQQCGVKKVVYFRYLRDVSTIGLVSSEVLIYKDFFK